jgi:acetolactate synthase-1/2/3 large subunit
MARALGGCGIAPGPDVAAVMGRQEVISRIKERDMAEITGGELLARAMAAEGIEFLFGLPSPEIDPLLAHLESYGIRLVPVRHEAAGVHMAEGLYKTTGRAAAVLGNPGPGSANLLPGVITARHEGIPVLVLTSQHRLGVVYPASPSTFQGQDQLEVFRPAVKWGGPVLEWSRLPEVLRLAFREMWSGRPGPVHVELPAPVLYELGEEEGAPVLAPRAYRAPQPQASEEQLAQAVALLAGAERPLVLSGSGVDRGGANAELIELVELLGCPVLSTMAGRTSVSAAHPNYVFGFGAAGDLARREADVILVAGSRMGNLDLPYDKYWGDPAGQSLIQIDIEPRNIGVTRPLALGIVADVGHALRGLSARLRAAGAAPRGREDLDRYRRADEAWRAEQFASVAEWEGEGIHPAHAMAVIGEVLGEDAVYVVDGGNTSLWAYSFLPPTGPRSYHSILELGMLGTGIPSAIGAKLGAPDRRVVCVTGDGAAGFNAMELQSAAREQLDIITIVFAEGSWTMEEPNELALYGRTFGTGQGAVRWDVMAQGLGCHGEYVEHLGDVAPALRRAIDTAGPSLICIHSDHDANLAVAPEMMSRFFEVYSGPLPVEIAVGA